MLPAGSCTILNPKNEYWNGTHIKSEGCLVAVVNWFKEVEKPQTAAMPANLRLLVLNIGTDHEAMQVWDILKKSACYM